MADDKAMISLTQALECVAGATAAMTLPSETIPVRQGLGRILVEEQKARLDLPPFNKSAMDGYAVLAGDKRQEYRLIEVVPAGKVPTRTLEPGTTIKVMTGAPTPEGAGRVIMIEHAVEAEGMIHIISHSTSTHICPRGEDIRRGDVIVRPTVLGPLEIANLISAGITEVKVARPVHVAILATGSEIVDSPEELRTGKIMNSNGPMLESLCRRFSLDVVVNSIVADERDVTVEALCQALHNADIVVLSGGVSTGDFDFAAEAMRGAGLRLHFNRLAVKPGRPMTFASSDTHVVFGLPGNPVAVFLMFHLFVLYAARLMAGLKPQTRYARLPLAVDLSPRKTDREAYLPCRLTADGLLNPVEYHGTAHLSALLSCDGFFVVPKGATKLNAGEKVNFISIRGSFA